MKTLYESLLDDGDLEKDIQNAEKWMKQEKILKEMGLRRIIFFGVPNKYLSSKKLSSKNDCPLFDNYIQIPEGNDELQARKFCGVVINLFMNIREQKYDLYPRKIGDFGDESDGVEYIDHILYDYKLDTSTKVVRNYRLRTMLVDIHFPSHGSVLFEFDKDKYEKYFKL